MNLVKIFIVVDFVVGKGVGIFQIGDTLFLFLDGMVTNLDGLVTSLDGFEKLLMLLEVVISWVG